MYLEAAKSDCPLISTKGRFSSRTAQSTVFGTLLAWAYTTGIWGRQEAAVLVGATQAFSEKCCQGQAKTQSLASRKADGQTKPAKASTAAG